VVRLIKRDNMEIKTKRLTIKPYSEDDEKDMLALLTNEIIKETFMIPDFETEQDAIAMFQKLLSFSHSGEHFELGIYFNCRLIGFLNDVEMCKSTIELGYVIHPDFHGLGFATEALNAVIDYLFNRGYQEIYAGAFENNIASMKVMKKCGMVQIPKTEDILYHNVNHHCLYFSIKRNISK
jgi:RimJ/RimL family protein N-acetyltransferase